MAYGPSLIHGYSVHTDLSKMTTDEIDTYLRLRKRRVQKTDSLLDYQDGENVKSVAMRFFELVNPSMQEDTGTHVPPIKVEYSELL